MIKTIFILLILTVLFGFISCQWGYGYNGYYPGGFGGYGLGSYGGYGGYGGFGARQYANVNNAARIGTGVAEGVLVAEDVGSALGK